MYKQSIGKDEDIDIKIKRNNEKLDFTAKLSEQRVTVTYTDKGAQIDNSINGNTVGEFREYDDEFVKDEALVGQTQTTNYIIGFVAKKKDVNLFNVWGEAWNETKFVVKLVYQSFWQMITGKIGVKEMSGPVGIVSEVNTAVNSGKYSLINVLNLIALLTINLGVFNLLPVPALDGGRIFFVLIEMVRRKPIPPDKEGMVHGIGMLLLLALVVFISFNDIIRLFN